MSKKSIAIFVILSFVSANLSAEGYSLFSYFMGNGEDGLHLAWSDDGLEWQVLNDGRSFLKPQVGGRLMRDPSIVQGPDGMFHMVWTTGWWDKGIGLAHSRDLIHWSDQEFLEVMKGESEARNCWAPEIFYDDASSEYVIFWSTTIPGRFPETDREERAGSGVLNHRMYFITTKDFKTFGETRLFYDDGFSVIDGFMIKGKSGYVLFIKDETRWPEAKKHIRMARSRSAVGPWSSAGPPVTVDWVEGPTAIKAGEFWYLYYDEYTRHHYGAMRSKDLQHWETVTDQLKMPDGIRHGTAFSVSETVLDQLPGSPEDKGNMPDMKGSSRLIEEIRIRDPYVVADKKTRTYLMYAQMDNRADREGSIKGVEVYASQDLKVWYGPWPVWGIPEGFWGGIQSVWAPEVHYYKGKYYLFVTLTSTDRIETEDGITDLVKRGTFVCKSDSPMGPFQAFDEKPHTPEAWSALDGTLWVEQGVPYMVFCHEWVQIEDGTMEIVRLSDDLSREISGPETLFMASTAPWVNPVKHRSVVYQGRMNQCYVTDGPFIYRTRIGQLLMIWSSFSSGNYLVGVLESESGTIAGPWRHQVTPLFKDHGGHGMIFERLDGQLMLVLHQPNSGPDERARFYELADQGDHLSLQP